MDLPDLELQPDLPPVPLPRTWWILPGRLLAGPFPGDRDPEVQETNFRALLTAGVSVFLNLQEEDETNFEGQYFPAYRQLAERLATRLNPVDPRFLYFRCPIRDMGLPSASTMRWILDQMDACLARGEFLYLHCWGGHGRSGTVAGCWLSRHGMDPKKILAQLQLRRQHDEYLATFPCPQTRDQERFIRRWGRA